MARQVWTIAAILTTALLLGLMGFSLYQKNYEAERLSIALEEARVAVRDAQARLEAAKAALAENQQRIEQLQKEKETVVQKHKSLEDEMRAALESKDVTISQLQGKLTVNILDRILFDSGEAELKPDGAAVLDKVAEILAQHPDLNVHVVGHTDNVPIRAGARSRFPSNWELSTARATAAVRRLVEKGIDPRRLGAVGYGEFRPVADNSTPEGRAANRRIAITILSDEIARADTSAPSPNFQPSPVEKSSATNGPATGEAAPANLEQPLLSPAPADTPQTN